VQRLGGAPVNKQQLIELGRAIARFPKGNVNAVEV
jgi:hypothetical protein